MKLTLKRPHLGAVFASRNVPGSIRASRVLTGAPAGQFSFRALWPRRFHAKMRPARAPATASRFKIGTCAPHERRTVSRCAPLKQQRTAFTLLELLVVILVVLMLLSLFPVSFAHAKQKAQRITCISNFKVVGTAYRLWAGDHGELPPSQQTMTNGGWADFLTNADQGAICWTNYAILRKELGEYPKSLICPADERAAAEDFGTNFRDNSHLSYFVGVSANDIAPQSIMGGDRNLGPGAKSDPDYGFSPKSGKGNDVAVPITGPVSWSLKIHSDGNIAGAGNILLGDGSGQQVSSGNLSVNWLRNAPPTTNWPVGRIPATPSIRLVFP